jgi:hypothetical protein
LLRFGWRGCLGSSSGRLLSGRWLLYLLDNLDGRWSRWLHDATGRSLRVSYIVFFGEFQISQKLGINTLQRRISLALRSKYAITMVFSVLEQQIKMKKSVSVISAFCFGVSPPPSLRPIYFDCDWYGSLM